LISETSNFVSDTSDTVTTLGAGTQTLVGPLEDDEARQTNNLVTFDIIEMLEQDSLTPDNYVPLIPDTRPHDRYLEDPVNPSNIVSTFVTSQEPLSPITAAQNPVPFVLDPSYFILPSFLQPDVYFEPTDVLEPVYQNFEPIEDQESADLQNFEPVSRPSTPVLQISNSVLSFLDPLEHVSDPETMFPDPDYLPLPQFLSLEPVTSTQNSTQTSVPTCDFVTLVPIMFFTSYLVYLVLAFLLRTIRLSKTFKKISFPSPYPRLSASKSKCDLRDDG
jgi:hypothetical protein